MKVGTTVVILDSEEYGYNVKLTGLTGVITEIKKGHKFCYMVELSPSGYTEVFTEDELRPLTKLERALK